MRRDYWLGRKRASIMLAGHATSAETALIDRKADERYYGELAQGAEYLASEAIDGAEIAEHIRMAEFYLRRARETAWGERLSS
jgi:hypothetical protein